MNHPTATAPDLVTGLRAVRLWESIAVAPAAPVQVGVQAAGGCGKTTLLDELAAAYRAAGVPVSTSAVGVDPETTAVIVDDAHRLDDSALRALRELTRHPRARLVVAYRPWPRGAQLSELVHTLGRTGPPVVLSGYTPDDLAARVERGLGSEPPAEWLDWLLAQTGGVPRFVEGVLADTAPHDLTRRGVPSRVVEQVQQEIDGLGVEGRACAAAIAVGAAAHPDVLAWLLELDPAVVVPALSAIRASGLTDGSDELLPLARKAAQLLTPVDQRLRIVRKLVRVQLDRGRPVLGLLRPFLESETAATADDALAEAFEQAGVEAAEQAPELASRFFDAAVSAGTPPVRLAARRARAAAIAGHFDEALRLADAVIVDETVPDRALGVQVAASVLAHRGLPARSAQLCRWSAEHLRWPGDRAYAAVSLIGTGRLVEAEGLLGAVTDPGPPTSLSGSTDQLVDGLRESITGSAVTALSQLTRSASLAEPVGGATLVPDTPAAIATLAALHCGELDVASSVVGRAIEAGSGGPMLAVRHRLLAAWIPLARGDTPAARAALDAAVCSPDSLQARDRLLATAIEAGIANRDNDTTALNAVRGRARQAIAEHPADLFGLLALGELAVSCARLHDQDWVEPHLRAAFTLLGELGDPPLWSGLLRWKCLQAAVVSEDADTARTHVAALEAMAAHNPMSAAMAAAAKTWLGVLAGEVDRGQAEQAARGLHAAGLTWDGARLAGQAALRTADRPTMLALLECARSLQGKPARPRAVGEQGEHNLLSEREREVAELVLSGLTYKQVGKRLFISAKTVEHHIGRIKQRLGATSREDLLTRLRAMLDS
ncbi:LuxR C-terminal-related transcriptional regulator [Saccharopolyspora sp. NFXS83]|uniref:LuxR C-terminal-related transcriptional regulator n=1 Tax=Saccharopolyspora sp. NFXS83 TaxID=2993560 RepID=UPI00224B30A8|nr:LuxR C-terminal-related transcriptional regulator [Saccharopolyspora sp. NFXS83]MCX2732583.1 LuxR C-terminal-related transcriptional regulator [Saccharopolyspora sp. NFXS83]